MGYVRGEEFKGAWLNGWRCGGGASRLPFLEIPAFQGLGRAGLVLLTLVLVCVLSNDSGTTEEETEDSR